MFPGKSRQPWLCQLCYYPILLRVGFRIAALAFAVPIATAIADISFSATAVFR